MPVSERERQVVQDMFDAMQAGPGGEEKMMSIFAEDAVMIDPFKGEPQAYNGKAAIRQRFIDIWNEPGPQDLSLTMDQIDAEGGEVRAEWTCTSSVFKTPMKGLDVFRIEDGLIKRLGMQVTAWPETDHH